MATTTARRSRSGQRPVDRHRQTARQRLPRRQCDLGEAVEASVERSFYPVMMARAPLLSPLSGIPLLFLSAAYHALRSPRTMVWPGRRRSGFGFSPLAKVNRRTRARRTGKSSADANWLEHIPARLFPPSFPPTRGAGSFETPASVAGRDAVLLEMCPSRRRSSCGAVTPHDAWAARPRRAFCRARPSGDGPARLSSSCRWRSLTGPG